MANAHKAVVECWNEYFTSHDAAQATTSSYNLTSTSLTPTTSPTDFLNRNTTTASRTKCTARFYELMGITRPERGESEEEAAKNRERLRSKGEFERFSQTELNIDGHENEPLRWCQERGKKECATLADIASTVFAIPSTSAGCERTFSRAGQMITDERYQLKANYVEADKLMKSWMIGGLVDREKAWRVLNEIEQQALLTQNQQPTGLEPAAASSDTDDEDDWVEWLTLAEFSANSMISETKGSSPFFATYGYQPPLGVEPYDPTTTPAHRDAENFASDMQLILEHLKAETALTQSRYEDRKNRRRQAATKFSVGQEVWLDARNLKTLRPPYTGRTPAD
ncbi:hypothetical protein KC316_g10666 [Hortaea werneckii]|nr:hypothetical protein KC324_g10899 [Hortaea werneckii]KAI7576514.1 hypothetical protein KC316_g10666 [Hortaea werneckii]